MPFLDPSSKNAIITRAGCGINLAYTKALHKAGCGILIADLSLHKDAESWLSSIKDCKGPKIHFHHADVTDWNQLEEVFKISDKEYGGAPDIVVPGAGVYEPSSNSFWGDVDKTSHYKLFDINLLHPIKMTRIALRKCSVRASLES